MSDKITERLQREQEKARGAIMYSNSRALGAAAEEIAMLRVERDRAYEQGRADDAADAVAWHKKRRASLLAQMKSDVTEATYEIMLFEARTHEDSAAALERREHVGAADKTDQ